MEEQRVVTKSQLKQIFTAWEANYRAGLTISHEECLSKSIDEISDRSSQYVWDCIGFLNPVQS